MLALGVSALTGLYDTMLALTTRERSWRPALCEQIAAHDECARHPPHHAPHAPEHRRITPAEMPMDGEMSEQTMRDLKTLGVSEDESGMGMDMHDLHGAKPFDRMFIDMMVPHHQGAIRMARAELAKGKNRRLRRIARAIVRDQAMNARSSTQPARPTTGSRSSTLGRAPPPTEPSVTGSDLTSRRWGWAGRTTSSGYGSKGSAGTEPPDGLGSRAGGAIGTPTVLGKRNRGHVRTDMRMTLWWAA